MDVDVDVDVFCRSVKSDRRMEGGLTPTHTDTNWHRHMAALTWLKAARDRLSRKGGLWGDIGGGDEEVSLEVGRRQIVCHMAGPAPDFPLTPCISP